MIFQGNQLLSLSNYFDTIIASGIVLLTTTISIYRARRNSQLKCGNDLVGYIGACHCGSIEFICKAPKHLVVWNCNCSICFMKKNWHFIIPESQFSLTRGAEALTEYKFNTKVARHLFCKHCGVQAFYRPRSNPDGYAVTLACISPSQVESYEIRDFDGQEWESFYTESGIQRFSVPS